MKVYCGFILATTLLLAAIRPSSAIKRDEIEYSFRERDDLAEGHKIVPRAIRFFSRPPSEDDGLHYRGFDIPRHIGNALSGGTVGVEVDMGKHKKWLAKIWNKMKSLFSKSQKFQKRNKDGAPSTRNKEDNDLEDEDYLEKDLVGEGIINPRLRAFLLLKELSEKWKNL